MYIIKSHLLGLNKWKEAITGKPHDMSLMSKLIVAVDVRLELWKYRRVYDMVLNDWLKCPFKRVSHVTVIMIIIVCYYLVGYCSCCKESI